MEITVHYTNTAGELFEWAHQQGKTLDHTVELLRMYYGATKIMIVVKP